jgi:hypothetical protein
VHLEQPMAPRCQVGTTQIKDKGKNRKKK